jgi:hypothetical protein
MTTLSGRAVFARENPRPTWKTWNFGTTGHLDILFPLLSDFLFLAVVCLIFFDSGLDSTNRKSEELGIHFSFTSPEISVSEIQIQLEMFTSQVLCVCADSCRVS